jgi:hypothetical protein
LTGSPGDKRLPRARHHLARVDPDPHLEPKFRDRLPHFDGGAHGAERVVLVRLRDPEDGQRRVADELLDRAAVPLQDRPQLRVIAAHRLAQELGIGALAERGGADEVAEDDRDRLSDIRSGLAGDHRAAVCAARKAVGRLLAALRADRHEAEANRALGLLQQLR